MIILLYILGSIIVLVVLIGIIGLLMPKQRIESRQSVYEAKPSVVYYIITDNRDWTYRSDLKGLKILESKNGIEVWDEIAKDSNTIRFKTREKIPYTFYSFDMSSKIMTGYWTAELKETEEGNTLFIATEYVRIKNPFAKVLSYLFFDLGKFMENYQNDLRKKIASL